MANEIRRFRGQFEFLSNFYASPLVLHGQRYPTVEHAYQAAKTLDPVVREQIRTAGTPGRAKRLARSPARGGLVVLRSDWEARKRGWMIYLLRRKFARPHLAAALLATGDAYLEEGNTWGDIYWGVCRGVGQNWLGKLLMRVRAELRARYENRHHCRCESHPGLAC